MNIVLGILALLVGLVIAGVAYERIFAAIDRRRYSEPPGEMIAVNGHRLYIHHMDAADDVPADMPTVILESGVSSNSLDWLRLQPLIAEFAPVVSYDRAGYGWSDEGPEPRTAKVITEELHTLLQKAGISPPYVLVGHSFGGLHVRRYAERYPDEVAGLVLLDSSHPEMIAEQDTEAELNRLRSVSRYKQFGIVRLLLPRILHRANHIKDAAKRKKYLAMMLLDSDNALREAAPLFSGDVDLSETVDVPLLVISRDTMDDVSSDLKWREYQEKLLELNPDARHETSRKGSHYIQLAEPELVARHIHVFLDDITNRNSAQDTAS